MNYWARLVYGHRYLDLATTPYDIGIDFSPPPLNRTSNFAGSARRGLDGAKRIGEEYGDRNWAVSFRVLGDTETECDQAKNKLSMFLENARNPRFKLYFEYYPQAAIDALPIWGQGVYRYHVKDAFLSITSTWGVRDQYIGGIINFLIAPTAEGLRQRLASAKGHIYEATIRTSTGESRGVYVCPPVTNQFTNPVFSHSTWNTGWTANGELTATKIADPAFVPFGDVSVKLQSAGTAGTVAYTQNIAGLGNGSAYIVSTYVRTMDGHEPGTAEVQLWYGAGLGAFNSYHVGDGWYRIFDTCSGTAGTVLAGLAFTNYGVSVYAGGFQLEQSLTTPTPLVFGDALGCSWKSTRGASACDGGTAYIRLPISSETVDRSAGVIRIAVKWDVPSTYDSNMYFFECDSSVESRFGAYFDAATDTIKFNAGDVILTSGTVAFGQNAYSILHFVWGKTSSGSAQICTYVNGTQYPVSTIGEGIKGDYLYIGSKGYAAPSGNPLRATILDFSTWKENLIPEQITDDYAQVYDWITSGDPKPPGVAPAVNVEFGINDNLGNRLNSIPYIWTKDGDDVVDCYSDATHNDWAVAGGIPGNLPAHSIFDVDTTINDVADTGLLLANLAYDNYLDMANTFYGTDVALAVGTAAVSFPGAGTAVKVIRDLDAYRGQKGYILTALTDAGTACQGAMVIHYATEANVFTSSYTSLATNATKRWFLVGPMLIPQSIPDYLDWMRGFGEFNYKFKLKRTTGTGTVTMDYYRLMVGDISYVPISGLTADQNLILDGLSAFSHTSTKEDGLVTTYGDAIELVPGKYNHLNALPIQIARVVNAADTVTFSRTYVIPRWSTV